jgi:hypothetical protein
MKRFLLNTRKPDVRTDFNHLGFTWPWAAVIPSWFMDESLFEDRRIDLIYQDKAKSKMILMGVPFDGGEGVEQLDYFISEDYYHTEQFKYLKKICNEQDAYLVFCNLKDGRGPYYQSGDSISESWISKLYEVIDRLDLNINKTVIVARWDNLDFECEKEAKKQGLPKFKNFNYEWGYLVDWDIPDTIQKKKYHFISLNRIRKFHRLYFGVLLHQKSLIENNVFSYWSYYTDEMELTEKNYFPKGRENEVRMVRDINPKLSRDTILDFLSKVPYKADDIKNPIDSEYSYTRLPELEKLCKESFVQIITETDTWGDEFNRPVFTEKTIKVLKSKLPFMIIGQPLILKYLKRLGFKTFDKWWDESYDTISKQSLNPVQNVALRTESVVVEIEKLCKLNMEEINLMYEDMKEVLEHNYNHINKLASKEYFLDKLNTTLDIY